MPPISRLPPSKFFPPAESADRHGLLGIGGRLSVEWLLDAYRHGIFPWPITGEEQVLAWWSLDPRAIFDLENFHVSRRLAQTCRSGRFEVTCDRDFRGVIEGCATANGRVGETWITPAMLNAYVRLHQRGHAHSVEAWRDGQLAGGVYGVAIGGLFSAESMFHTVRDASKVALVTLLGHLKARGYSLVDIQQLTSHTARFGAFEIPREEYLDRLAAALERSTTFGSALCPDCVSEK